MKDSEFRSEARRLAQEFNVRLKGLHTWDDFQQWFDDLRATQMGFGIHGKRRGYLAFDFRPHYFHPETRVQYLYDDGISTGVSDIKNLYRYLEVR